MNKKRITLLFSLLFLCMITVKAYAEEWIYLGESHVDGDHDHYKIHVGKHDGHFRAIQLRVPFSTENKKPPPALAAIEGTFLVAGQRGSGRLHQFRQSPSYRTKHKGRHFFLRS